MVPAILEPRSPPEAWSFAVEDGFLYLRAASRSTRSLKRSGDPCPGECVRLALKSSETFPVVF
jgi:hypothetical protein